MSQGDDIVSNLEYIVRASRAGTPHDETLFIALSNVMNWLALRVPYGTPLPRGYSVLYSIQPNPNGVMRRYHKLLKAASATTLGVWIDTANIQAPEASDIRVFAEDIAGGLLQEIIQFLVRNSSNLNPTSGDSGNGR